MSSQATFPGDCLPPEHSYKSREALFNAINIWAASRGYAFTTGKSLKTSSGRWKVIYSCDRSFTPPDPLKERQRKTATRGTGCQFSIWAKESLDQSVWIVQHRSDTRFSLHNHAPSLHPSVHPSLRQLSNEDAEQLSSLAKAGVAPREIQTILRQNPDSLVTRQDIYN